MRAGNSELRSVHLLRNAFPEADDWAAIRIGRGRRTKM